MSLPRLLFYVALGGLLGAVLVWGALALVYGPEVAFALRVLFSSAVAGVVRVYVADQNGDEVDIIPDVGPVGAEVVALGAADGEAAAKAEGAAARAAERAGLEWQARDNYGIEPLPGEFTKALRDRVYRAQIRALAPRGRCFTHGDLAALAATLSGGVVEVDNTTATVRITMPAGTSVERCEEVRADIAERMPPYVAVEVVCAAS